MKIVVWILVGIGALVLLGGVVLPLVHWLLGALGWLIAGALVIGGGMWLAKRSQSRGEVGSPQDAQRLP
ncbi:hypothetical protein [Actinomycetospora termitidis]|uniref:Uncharacterized protein n=1 Tax=Actinomycetospora termitidis TaxID=3053470 RepID=A0ABT7MB62_9PSEU|nr:hypothetical protein [Actinomycetospora sp. Odt1-22]MDL5157911.1 hypothetical protein [Actinomycetospora sp. Odt1-22]